MSAPKADLVEMESFSTFQDAANFAKSLAVEFSAAITVIRSELGFTVQAPDDVAKILTRERGLDSDSDPGQYGDDSWRADDESDLILEELREDQESWARSEESGWYYSDDDD